jgi:hypothetical protein
MKDRYRTCSQHVCNVFVTVFSFGTCFSFVRLDLRRDSTDDRTSCRWVLIEKAITSAHIVRADYVYSLLCSLFVWPKEYFRFFVQVLSCYACWLYELIHSCDQQMHVVSTSLFVGEVTTSVSIIFSWTLSFISEISNHFSWSVAQDGRRHSDALTNLFLSQTLIARNQHPFSVR